MNKQELIDYLNSRYEALEFWEGLREVMKCEQKTCSLKYQITKARKELKDMEILRMKNQVKLVKCPKCEQLLQPSGGCLYCPVCGWSECKG